jgi:hypothetical protein
VFASELALKHAAKHHPPHFRQSTTRLSQIGGLKIASQAAIYRHAEISCCDIRSPDGSSAISPTPTRHPRTRWSEPQKLSATESFQSTPLSDASEPFMLLGLNVSQKPPSTIETNLTGCLSHTCLPGPYVFWPSDLQLSFDRRSPR